MRVFQKKQVISPFQLPILLLGGFKQVPELESLLEEDRDGPDEHIGCST